MSGLHHQDPQVFSLIKGEEEYQRHSLCLIASENYVSQAVLAACGTVFQNKYSEGYPGARYYQGQHFCDQLESLAIERAKKLFGAEHANVQPYSGSPANLAVYLAFAQPGDTVMGLSLSHGGHLTHGTKASFSGKWFKSVPYHLDPHTELIDYDNLALLAQEHKPRILIAGHSAYPRQLDFARFRQIADSCGAILLVDMSHIAGLVAAGVHPSPIPYADVVSTTTHKTLRGPRGALLLSKKIHASKIDKAVFPGVQGGPHNATTAAIAVALQEAANPDFALYGEQIVKNARALASQLMRYDFRLISGGTDNHLLLVDLRPQGITGKTAALALEKANIICNYNTVPREQGKAADPSGIRLGTAALTSRGFGPAEMVKVADLMHLALQHVDDEAALQSIAAQVKTLCAPFKVPGLD